MQKKNSWFLVKVLPLIALTAGVLMATPTLTISTAGASTVTLTSASGLIQYSHAIGAWNITVDTAETAPLLGSAAVPTMLLTSTDQSLSTAGALTIEFSANNFTPALPSFESLLSTQSGDQGLVSNPLIADGTVTLSAYYDPTNLINGTTATDPLHAILLSTFSSSGATYTNSKIGPLTPSSSLYSLTLVAVVTHTQSALGQTDLTMNESVVPEPGFYGVLALGLGGLILAVQRMRKATAKV